MARTEEYTFAGIFIKEGSAPIIKTGEFSFFATKDIVLSDAKITHNDDGTINVTGYTHEFEYHADTYDGEDLRDRAEEYYVEESDWYTAEPNWLGKLLGRKPIRRLDSGWYMEKKRKAKVSHTFHGSVVEQHTTSMGIPLECIS